MPVVAAPLYPPDGPWRWPSTVRGGNPAPTVGSPGLGGEGVQGFNPNATSTVLCDWSKSPALSGPYFLILKECGRERTPEPLNHPS